jgi:hypothetical protein
MDNASGGKLPSAVKSMPDMRLDRRGNRYPANGEMRIMLERFGRQVAIGSQEGLRYEARLKS